MWVRTLCETAEGEWVSKESGLPGDPGLVLFFGPTDLLKSSAAPSRLRRKFPSAIQVGCSTCTAVDSGELVEKRITSLVVGFDHTRLKLATQHLEGPEASHKAGFALGQQLLAPDLAAVFVISEGLGVNGSGLVAGLVEACGPEIAVSGGMAGDGARFADTVVLAGAARGDKLVAAIGFYGSKIRLGHGTAGGWDEFGPIRRITRSEGTVLAELDGKPALDLYERYLGDEAAELPASGLFYPLKIWDPTHPEDEVVRTVLSVDRAARTMTFAGDIPEGWNARLMRGSFDRLTEGAAEAALHARAQLNLTGETPALCLFVSCVGRRLLMGQRTEDEIEAVAEVLGAATPIAGFYSYGEISPSNRSGACGLHNQTVTLTLLAEAA